MAGLLKKICIQHFLGYEDKQEIEIAIPNGKMGSGITFIVGEINTGKSAIFEAIKKLHSNAKFLPKERNKGINPIIELIDKNDAVTKIERGEKAMVSITSSGLINEQVFELVPSRRHWNHTFHANNVGNYTGYLTQSYHSNSKGTTDAYLGGLLEKIADDLQLKTEFDSMMKFLVPGFSDWEIDTDNESRDVINYKVGKDIIHDTSLLGDGLISLFRICAHLVSTDDDLVLYIDEPELSLSPSIQKKLAQLLAKKGSNKQIILNTHCTHMIRWQDIVSGAKVSRTRKDFITGKCGIKRLNSESEAFNIILRSLEDWQKPQALDAVAKEIFFSDKILFLEGQEDVGLIKKFISDKEILINFDIFGYGTGGAANIPAYLEMASNLGIKAAAVFDANAPGYSKAKILEQSNPNLKNLAHLYDDIRYKEDKPERTGLFEENGSITESKEKELLSLINELKDFFNDDR
jgi:predicted ATP-dependent endonuclease of OLD family